MRSSKLSVNVGCSVCWSTDAVSAWSQIKSVPIETYLIAESHFIVSLRRCASCGQWYLQVTTETIDWDNGDDPVFRTIVPLSEMEQRRLLRDQPPSELDLLRLGSQQPSLCYDHPSGAEASVYWGRGMRVGPHD
ncbi:MAG: hypothetical protein AAGH76_09645 [Pseudomonadota bacterium]